MKRLLLAILFSAFSIAASAQSVYSDRISLDGRQMITSSGTKVDIGGNQYTIFVAASTSDNAPQWALLVGSELFMSDDTQVLIKLDNDEIIHLLAEKVSISSLSSPDRYTTYHFGGVSETYLDPGTKRDYYNSIFWVTDEHLFLLENHKIKKIRISLGSTYLEKASGLKKMSRELSRSIKAIRSRMTKPSNSLQNFTEGF